MTKRLISGHMDALCTSSWLANLLLKAVTTVRSTPTFSFKPYRNHSQTCSRRYGEWTLRTGWLQQKSSTTVSTLVQVVRINNSLEINSSQIQSLTWIEIKSPNLSKCSAKMEHSRSGELENYYKIKIKLNLTGNASKNKRSTSILRSKLWL